jgi:isochorismate hydrolase
MERAYGLEIPQSLEEVCDPRRLALVVYDMQVGVLNQISQAAQVTEHVVEVLRAARDGGFRVTDACGAGHEEAAKRSIDSLAFSGDALLTDTATVTDLLRRHSASGRS